MRLKQGTIKLTSLEEAHKAGLDFLEKCEKGGTLNNYTVDGVVVGYKAIPKTRKFLTGEDIDQIFIYTVNNNQI